MCPTELRKRADGKSAREKGVKEGEDRLTRSCDLEEKRQEEGLLALERRKERENATNK